MKDLQPLSLTNRLSGTLAVGILTTFYCMWKKKPVKAKGNFYVKHDCQLANCLSTCMFASYSI